MESGTKTSPRWIFVLLILVALLLFFWIFLQVREPPLGPDGKDLVRLSEGQRYGPLLVTKIYADHIDGLNYIEYPVAREDGIPLTLYIGETASNGCTIQMTLVRIEGDIAVFSKSEDFTRPCPICLSGDTLIDTPMGRISVKYLHEGMPVWTYGDDGERRSVVILKAAKVKAPKTHEIIHIVLNDGRELFASPGHQLSDGRALGIIKPGDIVDRARVITAELIPYDREYTYDILPSGNTGMYWAGGILLRSTLP